jgi:WD40 repeat protein
MDYIRRVALNRDGSLLAASSQLWTRSESHADGEVMLWKLPQRELLFKSSGLDIVKLAFSEDDQRLAAYTLGPPAMVWLWSVPEGKPVERWGSSEAGQAMALAPGGHVLATAGTDQFIRLFEMGQTNHTPRLLEGHTNAICSLKFAADGRLISASKDHTVRVWDIRQSPSSQAFSLPPGRMICAPNAQAQRIVSVNLINLTFEDWDIESGQFLRQRPIQGAEVLLPHGATSSERKRTLLGNWLIVGELPDGDSRVRVMLTSADSGSPAWDLRAVTGDGWVYAWNAESGELVYSNKVAPTLGPTVYPVADHTKLVLIEDSKFTFSSYDLKTHQREAFPELIAMYSCKPAVSPNSRLFTYFTTSGQVKVWDAIRNETKSIVKLPVEYTFTAFSPDSRWLAVANRSGRVQVFDIGTGQSVCGPLAGYLADTVRVDFSADSKSLVTYSGDRTAKIWNIASGREMISGLRLNPFLAGHLPTRLLPLDGNSIFESAGEGAIRLVRLPTLAEIDARENGAVKDP